ncbi:MAG: hypothetical protein HYZ28_21235 [Myxococcales bacterium]|nr:hypothetical protein [Myxococcales bacterium]
MEEEWLPDDYSWQVNDFGLLDRFSFHALGHDLRPGFPPPPPDPHPAPIVRYLRWALQIQKDIDEKGWTFRQAGRFHGISYARVSQLLELTRLAPDIQEKVLALKTSTPCHPVTVQKLRGVARELDWKRQREQFALLMVGEHEAPAGRDVSADRGGGELGPRAETLLPAEGA